jgi:hypothetical protein
MVVRTRLRAILFPLVFYVVLGVASGYLVWDAWNGQRGLKAKAEYAGQTKALGEQLQALRADALRRGRPRSARRRGQGGP